MTISAELSSAPAGAGPDLGHSRPDHRGSPIPTWSMITTRFMELRKRRGLMVALIIVNIGLPSLFLLIRLLSHAFDPKSYGPAGGYDIFSNLVSRIMFIFGFIVAATLGSTAGSIDLTEGMFRHLVVTGRSRIALYFARIPAGLAIVVPIVAIGFTIVCAVCVYAAPTTINYQGVSVPAGLSQSGFEAWAGDHSKTVVCQFPYNSNININVPCGNGPGGGVIIGQGGSEVIKRGPGGAAPTPPPLATAAQTKFAAILIAKEDYAGYKLLFLYPSDSLMIQSGLWIELEAAIGFIVGLGLSSLIGQRTISVVAMIVLEIILTPLFSMNVISHLINLQRSVVGVAMAHIEPASLPAPFGGGGGPGASASGRIGLIPESTTVSVIVIVAWIVVWIALGAWRMATRDT